MTAENEELSVPKEIQELFEEGMAYRLCRDECIKSIFKTKRAIYFAKKSVKADNEAWSQVYDLWPQVRKGLWSYNHYTKKVSKN